MAVEFQPTGWRFEFQPNPFEKYDGISNWVHLPPILGGENSKTYLSCHQAGYI